MRSVERRTVLGGLVGVAASCALPRGLRAEDLPAPLADVQKQYYNFMRGLLLSPNAGEPLLVLNNTITPFDADPNTPYFNQHLFRMYADQTFSSSASSFITPGAMNQSGRFSSLYRDVISIAASQVDQNHPEIAQVVTDLQSRRSAAQRAFNAKDQEFTEQWQQIAASRGLQEGTREYALNYLKWLEDVRYVDQMADYSTEIDRLNSQITAVRRSKYTTSEIALLDNLDALSSSFDIARPRYAQTELDQAASGERLTDIMLADPKRTPAALFDRSPLILPIADLRSFLTNEGSRTFDSSRESRQISSGSESWFASGGASFFGWQVGAGGSGSSSYRRDVENSVSLNISFKNIQEIYIDRGQWFDPGVLQDPAVLALVRNLRQLESLKYAAVSLFVGRGLTMSLELKDSASAADWATQAIRGRGGASFFGFSFGASGGRDRTSQNFTSSATGAKITFADGDAVIRVLGARVEPLVQPPRQFSLQSLGLRQGLTEAPGRVEALTQELLSGRITYMDFQKRRIAIQGR